MRIGGVEQFITIQGRERRNPVVLVLHGGPANAMSPFLSLFEPWETDFTVVSWDQRGAGKTYGRSGSVDLSPERIVSDAIEVAEYAGRTLGRRKIILLGHSYGAMLGWRLVQARPDLLSVFVGTGMMANYGEAVLLQEAFAAKRAAEAGDAAALAAMQRAKALPVTDITRMRPTRPWLPDGGDPAYFASIHDPFISKAATSPDAKAWVEGQRATVATPSILQTMLNYDIAAEGMNAAIPVAVIQGRQDRITPVEPARNFVQAVKAPRKAFTVIEGGHMACFTNPREFVPALRSAARMAR